MSKKLGDIVAQDVSRILSERFESDLDCQYAERDGQFYFHIDLPHHVVLSKHRNLSSYIPYARHIAYELAQALNQEFKSAVDKQWDWWRGLVEMNDPVIAQEMDNANVMAAGISNDQFFVLYRDGTIKEGGKI